MKYIKAPLFFFLTIFLSIIYSSEIVFAENNFDLKRNQTNADSIKLDYVFKNGDDGYLCYRIPGIITTNKGTLLAFAEGRKNHCGDAGDIDLIVKRLFARLAY